MKVRVPPKQLVAIATGALTLVGSKLIDYLKVHHVEGTLSLVLFSLFYLVAIIVIILYYTGVVQKDKLKWVIILLAILVFPVIIYL